MELNIIPVANELEQDIVDLILTIQQKEFNIPITVADQSDLLDIRNFYYRGGGSFFGAFVDGKLIGTIALIKFSPSAGAIRKMFVKKEYRGKQFGIAQQLLETLIAYSNRNGITDLYLGTVAVLQAALRFYEKNHFIRLPKEELPEAFPLMKPDTIFCHLKLH